MDGVDNKEKRVGVSTLCDSKAWKLYKGKYTQQLRGCFGVSHVCCFDIFAIDVALCACVVFHVAAATLLLVVLHGVAALGLWSNCVANVWLQLVCILGQCFL